MKAIIAEIKSEIKNHKSIRNSALNDVSPWKRAQYMLLASIISKELSHSKHLEGERKFELGTTLSYITLQRFFEDNYSSSAINDLRFVKTLHKLCIFLGYYDLNEYIISSSSINSLKKDEEYAKTFCKIIENLCLAEFDVLREMPNKNLEDLYPFSPKESPTIKRIRNYVEKYQKAKYYFDRDYNEAKFELVSCDLIADEPDLKVLKTMEHWDFILKNNEGKTFYYKVFNGQTYYLKKDKDGVWKIWDNYNPNLQRIMSNYI